MNKEQLIRRLEERLARGEISEKTYLDIKARYAAMPDEPEPDAEEASTEEPVRHPVGSDLEGFIESTIEQAMEQVAQHIEHVKSHDFQQRMEHVGRRVSEAFAKVGPRVEAGGKRIVIRGSGVVTTDTPIDEFKCAGSGKVVGTLRANEAHIAGACVIEGGCECREFHSAGKTEVQSDVKAQEFHSSGRTSVAGDLRAQDVAVSGKAEVAGSILDAQDVRVSGSVKVGGRVRTQDFRSRGRFVINEGLEAQNVDIRLGGASRVPTITAKEVVVRRGERKGELEVGTIEADEVYVEATRAGLIRGKEVHVGPFCTIAAVEAGELEVHETSTVKEQRPLTDASKSGS